jgi:hypothetical protein
MSQGMNSTTEQYLVGYGESASNKMFTILYGIGPSYNYGISSRSQTPFGNAFLDAEQKTLPYLVNF